MVKKMDDTYFKHEFESRSSLVKGLFVCQSVWNYFVWYICWTNSTINHPLQKGYVTVDVCKKGYVTVMFIIVLVDGLQNQTSIEKWLFVCQCVWNHILLLSMLSFESSNIPCQRMICQPLCVNYYCKYWPTITVHNNLWCHIHSVTI